MSIPKTVEFSRGHQSNATAFFFQFSPGCSALASPMSFAVAGAVIATMLLTAPQFAYAWKSFRIQDNRQWCQQVESPLWPFAYAKEDSSVVEVKVRACGQLRPSCAVGAVSAPPRDFIGRKAGRVQVHAQGARALRPALSVQQPRSGRRKSRNCFRFCCVPIHCSRVAPQQHRVQHVCYARVSPVCALLASRARTVVA
jgi:hypothetical protein